MTEQNSQPEFAFNLEKIYVKDSSFEVPNAPLVFLEAKAPEIGVQLGIQHSRINAEQALYEVVLAVTVTAKLADKNVFLAETHQAGLFRISGVPDQELPKVLEIACPNVLLPFARQVLSAMIESGGFPQLLINPINFESLYIQKQQAAVSKTAAH